MNVIVKPAITEKITSHTEKLNRYGFIVKREANKLEIKSEVEKAYGVKVAEVNTMNYGGRSKSRYTKTGVLNGRTSPFKKAIVTLAPGETIDFYSNI